MAEAIAKHFKEFLPSAPPLSAAIVPGVSAPQTPVSVAEPPTVPLTPAAFQRPDICSAV